MRKKRELKIPAIRPAAEAEILAPQKKEPTEVRPEKPLTLEDVYRALDSRYERLFALQTEIEALEAAYIEQEASERLKQIHEGLAPPEMSIPAEERGKAVITGELQALFAVIEQKKQECATAQKELEGFLQKTGISLSSERFLERGNFAALYEQFAYHTNVLESRRAVLEAEFHERHLEKIGPEVEQLLALKLETEEQMNKLRQEETEFRLAGDIEEADIRKKEFYKLTDRRTQIKVLIGEWDRDRGFEVQDQKIREILGIVEGGRRSISTGISQEEASLFRKVEPLRKEWDAMQKEVKQEVERLRREIRGREGKLSGVGVEEGATEELEELRDKLVAAEQYQREIRTLDNTTNEKVVDFLNRCREKGVNFKQAMQQLEHFSAERRKQEQAQKQEGATFIESTFDWRGFQRQARQYLNIKPRLDLASRQIEDNRNAEKDFALLAEMLPKNLPEPFDVDEAALIRLFPQQKEQSAGMPSMAPVVRVRFGKLLSKGPRLTRVKTVERRGGAAKKLTHALLEEFYQLQTSAEKKIDRLWQELYVLESRAQQKKAELALLSPEIVAEKIHETQTNLENAENNLASLRERKDEIIKEIAKKIGKPVKEKEELKIEKDKRQERKKSKKKKKEKEQKQRERTSPEDIYKKYVNRLNERISSLKKRRVDLEALQKLLFNPEAAAYEERVAERLKQIHEGLAPPEVSMPETVRKFYEKRAEFLGKAREKQNELNQEITRTEDALKNAEEQLYALQAGEAKNPAALKFYQKLARLGLTMEDIGLYAFDASIERAVANLENIQNQKKILDMEYRRLINERQRKERKLKRIESKAEETDERAWQRPGNLKEIIKEELKEIESDLEAVADRRRFLNQEEPRYSALVLELKERRAELAEGYPGEISERVALPAEIVEASGGIEAENEKLKLREDLLIITKKLDETLGAIKDSETNVLPYVERLWAIAESFREAPKDEAVKIRELVDILPELERNGSTCIAVEEIYKDAKRHGVDMKSELTRISTLDEEADRLSDKELTLKKALRKLESGQLTAGESKSAQAIVEPKAEAKEERAASAPEPQPQKSEKPKVVFGKLIKPKRLVR